MKVAYLATGLPQRCGIATYTNYLIQGLLKADPQVEVILLAEKGTQPVTSPRYRCLPCFSRDEEYPSQVLGELRETAPDVLHIQHEFGIFGFDRRFIELLKGVRVKKVITLHSIYTRETIFKKLDFDIEEYIAKIVELADTTLVHQNYMLEILHRLGAREERVKVIPHGTQITEGIDQKEVRREFGLPEEGKLILSFGFIGRVKNVISIIEALPLVLNEVKDVYLFDTGLPKIKDDYDYEAECQRRAEELGVEDHVYFKDEFVPEEDVPYTFAASDVVVFTNDNERSRAVSGGLHLALGAGKPVVASRVPRFDEEILLNISEEILILPHDVERLAKIIIRLFTDDDFRDYAIGRVRDFARRTSWENIAGEHLILYHENSLYAKGNSP